MPEPNWIGSTSWLLIHIQARNLLDQKPLFYSRRVALYSISLTAAAGACRTDISVREQMDAKAMHRHIFKLLTRPQDVRVHRQHQLYHTQQPFQRRGASLRLMHQPSMIPIHIILYISHFSNPTDLSPPWQQTDVADVACFYRRFRSAA